MKLDNIDRATCNDGKLLMGKSTKYKCVNTFSENVVAINSGRGTYTGKKMKIMNELTNTNK